MARGERERALVSEDAPERGQHLAVLRLGLLPPALLGDRARDVVPGDERPQVVGAQHRRLGVGDLAVDVLGLGPPALLAGLVREQVTQVEDAGVVLAEPARDRECLARQVARGGHRAAPVLGDDHPVHGLDQRGETSVLRMGGDGVEQRQQVRREPAQPRPVRRVRVVERPDGGGHQLDRDLPDQVGGRLGAAGEEEVGLAAGGDHRVDDHGVAAGDHVHEAHPGEAAQPLLQPRRRAHVPVVRDGEEEAVHPRRVEQVERDRDRRGEAGEEAQQRPGVRQPVVGQVVERQLPGVHDAGPGVVGPVAVGVGPEQPRARRVPVERPLVAAER